MLNDPAGQVMELSAANFAIHGGADDVEIKNLSIVSIKLKSKPNEIVFALLKSYVKTISFSFEFS